MQALFSSRGEDSLMPLSVVTIVSKTLSMSCSLSGLEALPLWVLSCLSEKAGPGPCIGDWPNKGAADSRGALPLPKSLPG